MDVREEEGGASAPDTSSGNSFGLRSRLTNGTPGSGDSGVSGSLGEAQEALRLAEAAPAEAIALAEAVVRRTGAGVAFAVAHRAWGLALRHRGDLDRSIAHLRTAVRGAEDVGAADVAAGARLTLAHALAERGRTTAALRELDHAMAALDGTPEQGRALAQRGVILLDLGDHEAALRCYRDALPVLRDAGDTLWVYRVVWNRGLALAYRHEFAAAEADLRQAEALAEELDLPLSVGYARANIAFVLGLRGEVAAALEYSARAERRIRKHEAQLGELLKDRSELLLSVRLVAEARDTAEQAVHEFEREQRGMKLPQVRLLLAQAALLDGDPETALRHSRLAAREFGGQQRPEWAALARLGTIRAQHVAGRSTAHSARAAAATATALAAARWPAAALDAHILTAEILRDRGRPAAAASHLRLAAAARTRGPAMLRARAWYAEALIRLDAGQTRAARSAIRTGLRVLDEHRGVLGATDMRARAAGHRSELADLGLDLALATARPRQVLEWAERSRATGMLLQQPATPPVDPEAAQRLAELRATVLRINELHLAGRGPDVVAPLQRRQHVLERQLRDRDRQRRGTAAAVPEPVQVDELAAQLGDTALLELVVRGGSVTAVTVVDGQARLRRLGPSAPLDRLVDRIAFAMARLLRRGVDTGSRDAAHLLLANSTARIDELLMRPLPELGDRPLVVVPTGSLQNLPWAALPSCAARSVTVAPSASLWHAARSRPVRPGHVVVVAGPHLPGAEAEAVAVAKSYGVEPMLPPHATVEAVLGAINGAAMLHIAAHGKLATHNPLFSDLLLTDGPLFAHDLERLATAPHTVVLASCESGGSVVCAGDELLGLSATLLAAGTAQLVASALPVPDLETAPVMEAFHAAMAAGRTAADALADARRRVRGEGPAEVAATAFVCLGAGFSAVSPLSLG